MKECDLFRGSHSRTSTLEHRSQVQAQLMVLFLFRLPPICVVHPAACKHLVVVVVVVVVFFNSVVVLLLLLIMFTGGAKCLLK